MIKSSFVPKRGYELDCDPFDASLYTTVRKHIRLMAGKFYTILSDEDIEDLTHDAYLRVMENRDKADLNKNINGWIYRICRSLDKNNMLGVVIAVVLLNRRSKKPIVEMAIGPVACILFGLLVNVLLLVGLVALPA